MLVLVPSATFAQCATVLANQQEDSTAASSFKMPTQVSSTEEYLRLEDGGKLWYSDTGGNGEAVILMHPASVNGQVWGFQQPAFAQAGFRVITYSRRGYAPSESIGARTSYAADDLSKLLDGLSVERAHLVAAAHGGSFAVDFVLSFPHRVRSLTLQSSLIGIDEPEYQAMLSRLLPPFFGGLPSYYKELGPAFRARSPKGVAAWNRIASTARNKENFSFQLRRHSVDYPVLESVSTPTLIVGGGADLYAPSPLLELQAAHISNSKLIVIPEVGHSAYWEVPAKFNRLVVEFLIASE